ESLHRLGLERNTDYTIRPMGSSPARLSALTAGQVDAVPLGSEDRVQLEAEGLPVLVETGKVLPEFPQAVVGASKAFVAAKPERIAGFLRAVERGTDFIRQNPDRAVELGKANGLEGDPAVARKVVDRAADNWHVRLTRGNVAAVLAAREIEGSPDDFF